jgi:release factor glutamine methyltransferase
LEKISDEIKSTTFKLLVEKKLEDMIISDLKNWLDRELAIIFDKNEARSISRLLVEEYFGFGYSSLLIHADELLDPEIFDKFKHAVDRLKNNVPVQYILGKASFLGFDLKVGPGVLIPRPETEELALLVINDYRGNSGKIRILDIGTGSACLPIALDGKLDDVELTGIEASGAALGYAKENIAVHDAEVKLIQLDFLNEANWGSLEVYDVIISNPPYVTKEDIPAMRRNVTDHEPAKALFADDLRPLLFYEKIMSFSREHLRKGGRIYLEINEKHGPVIVSLLKDNDLDEVILLKDSRGKDRFIKSCRK